MNIILSIFGHIASILPSILALCTVVSLLFGYHDSDKLVQEFFSSKSEKALYLFFSYLKQFFLAAFFCVLFFFYIGKSSNVSPKQMREELLLNKENSIVLILLFALCSLVFLILINFTKNISESLFPTKAPMKRKTFYILSNDINVDNIPSNTKLYFSNRIDKHTNLFVYECDGETIRILLNSDDITRQNIYYNSPVSVIREFIDLYIQNDKTFRRTVLASCSFVLIMFLLIAYTISDLSILIPSIATVLLIMGIMYLPQLYGSLMKSSNNKKKNKKG